MTPQRVANLVFASVSLFAVACAQPAEAPKVLRLTQVRPKNPSGVYLNESLVFHFSAELDRSSVNRRSVRIAALDGTPPRGDLSVDGDEIRFLPAPVLASTLDDGGYRPDTEYTVRIVGFPNPDGLRSLDGAPLERTSVWSFKTVSIAEPRTGAVFEDHTPGGGALVKVQSDVELVLHPAEPIRIEGGEPIDPSSLHVEDFTLHAAARIGGHLIETGDPIAMRADLADNRDPHEFAGGRTILELWPLQLLTPGSYVLGARPELATHLHDFGGHPVWPYSKKNVFIRVDAPIGSVVSDSFVESFVDTSMSSAAEVPEADGTALWSGSGKLELRYPAAVGVGSVGNATLAGLEVRHDIRARNLTVEADEIASLSPTPGLVVLRATRRMTISGTLERVAPAIESACAEITDVAAWSADQFGEARDVSTWLLAVAERERLAPSDPRRRISNWTVLIAGGDLTISGELHVHGPLLLVAGGRIRVSGSIELLGPKTQIQASCGTVVGAAAVKFPGGYDDHILMVIPRPAPLDRLRDRVDPQIDTSSDRKCFVLREDKAIPVPLSIDPPLHNPLQGDEKLVFQVLSSPIPPTGNVGRWRTGAIVHGFSGARAKIAKAAASRYSVRYVGQPSSSPSGEITVDDPALLGDAKTLRLLIQLEVRASDGDRWDPPWVDDVTVFWDRATAEAGH